MIETRRDHEYAARVWMQETLSRQVHREALARIEALLPSGYRYNVRKGKVRDSYGHDHEGWVASFGEGDGTAWMVPHAFHTEAAAIVGLLALLIDGCVYPGCTTAYLEAGHAESVRVNGHAVPSKPEAE